MSQIDEFITPEKVRRRLTTRTIHKRRLCKDNRAYFSVPFTITGDIVVGDYAPMWRVDRDCWIAGITANIGKHDASTHPADGTPSGSTLEVNMRRVSTDLSTDAAIIATDSRLSIDIDHHQDWANDNENGAYVESDFNVPTLTEGEHVYVRVGQVGSGRPGSFLVVTLVLVPVR